MKRAETRPHQDSLPLPHRVTFLAEVHLVPRGEPRQITQQIGTFCVALQPRGVQEVFCGAPCPSRTPGAQTEAMGTVHGWIESAGTGQAARPPHEYPSVILEFELHFLARLQRGSGRALPVRRGLLNPPGELGLNPEGDFQQLHVSEEGLRAQPVTPAQSRAPVGQNAGVVAAFDSATPSPHSGAQAVFEVRCHRRCDGSRLMVAAGLPPPSPAGPGLAVKNARIEILALLGGDGGSRTLVREPVTVASTSVVSDLDLGSGTRRNTLPSSPAS